MYTLCYTTLNGEDRWVRCDSMKEAAGIIHREGIEDCLEDILLFSPDADDCTVDLDQLAAYFG